MILSLGSITSKSYLVFNAMHFLFEKNISSELGYFFQIKNPFCYHRKDLLVGVAGFEPAASCSQSRRDNRATLHPEGECKYRIINQ